MKIIAVNISKTSKNKTLLQATERAWMLNINRAKKYDFVIGVENNSAKSFFKINDVNIDRKHINRVMFDLVRCSDSDKIAIKKYIDKQTLKRFTTKYLN